MPLKTLTVIEIPNGANSDFDHAAFDPKTRRVFIAHTGRDCIEVIDHDAQKHIATLPGFPGVAGAVADDGEVLTTNRGAASVTWLDAATAGMYSYSCPCHRSRTEPPSPRHGVRRSLWEAPMGVAKPMRITQACWANHRVICLTVSAKKTL